MVGVSGDDAGVGRHIAADPEPRDGALAGDCGVHKVEGHLVGYRSDCMLLADGFTVGPRVDTCCRLCHGINRLTVACTGGVLRATRHLMICWCADALI